MDAFKGPCWCANQEFPDELTARIPADHRNRACICRACVEAAACRRGCPDPGDGDSYVDPASGLLVFTAQYLRRRGYCCDSGCRHCPWESPPTPDSAAAPRQWCAAAAGGILTGMGLALGGSGMAGTFTETFDSNPATSGWRATGDSELFQWNPEDGSLWVTWDSSKPHSFFAHPLGATLGAHDAFAFGLDLRLDDATGGVRPPRTGAMQVSFGLLNLNRAIREHYPRAAGRAFDLVEFNWFPEGEFPGFGVVDATASPAVFGSTGRVAASFTFPLGLATGVTHRIRCTYLPAQRTLMTHLNSDGADVEVRPVRLPEDFGSFSLNAFAVINWTESDGPYDSIMAHGQVDNVFWEHADPLTLEIHTTSPGVVEFDSLKGWIYHLDASDQLGPWSGIDSAAGTGQRLIMSDPRDAVYETQFYRVRAEPE